MYRIGIMDSGVGGLSVYRRIVELLPNASYIYYSDNAWCPYGDKAPSFVLERARTISEMMVEKGVDIIVIACNTATAAAVRTLRTEFSIPFVGMEPAVKPAALGTKSGVVGVLATAGTLRGSLYIDTKGRYQNSVRIIERVGKGFVELVENGVTRGPEAERVVSESLQPLLDEGADIIVLGCTHYPFLLDVMKKIAEPDVRFIDPAPAVARRVRDILKESEPRSGDSDSFDIELLSSGSSGRLRKMFTLMK